MTEIGTGRTIGHERGEADSARRREMLAEFSVRVTVNAKKAPPAGHQAAARDHHRDAGPAARLPGRAALARSSDEYQAAVLARAASPRSARAPAEATRTTAPAGAASAGEEGAPGPAASQHAGACRKGHG